MSTRGLGLTKRRPQHSTEDEFEEAAPPKRSRSGRENNSQTLSQSQSQREPIRCGKVLSIQLSNFMCHNSLRMDFHERVNFLVGCNGSGKSAILAALVLGMGANARVTSRSTSMKQFIKSGESSAKIEITISNEGEEAYDPQTFGSRITIVRTITQSSATYAIKSEDGTVISRKFDALQRILMYHNVQVENPVFVLNQDSAREFLKDLDPVKNYKLFLKATQIDLILEKNSESLKSHKEHMIQLSVMKKKLIRDRNAIEELNSKLLKIQSLAMFKQSVRQKELERNWLLVAFAEKELANSDEKAERLHKKQASLEMTINGRDGVESQLKEKISKCDADAAAKNLEYKKENTSYQDLKTKVTQTCEREHEIASYLDTYGSRKAFLKQQIEALNGAIETSQRNLGDINEARTRNETKLKELRANHVENEAIVESAKRDLKMFMDNKIQKDEQIKYLKESLALCKRNIHHLDVQIVNTNTSSKDKLSIFGDQMLSLKAEIDKYYKAGRFSALPRGPIGSYIEVPNENFRDVIENQIGNLLNGFIVSNTKDRLTLLELMKKISPTLNAVIITSKFMNQVYDVRRGRVTAPRGTRVLLDEIKCTDPIVMNCLIDRIQIETILLTDSHKLAEEITANRENVPQNLNKVIVPKPGLEYYPAPKYRMYSMKIRPARIIQVNVKERVDQLKQEKQELEANFMELQTQLRNFEAQLEDDLKPIKEKRSLVEKYDIKKYELREKISELENFDYPDHNQVDHLKTELAKYVNKLATIDNETKHKTSEHSEIQEEKLRLECEMKKQEEKVSHLLAKVNAAKDKAEAARLELHYLSDKFQSNQENLNEVLKVIADFEYARSCVVEKLNKATAVASASGERVESESTVEKLNDEIKALKAKLKHSEQLTDDLVELENLILAKKNAFEVDKLNYDQFKKSISMIREALFQRFDYVKQMKQHMVLCMQYAFQSILKIRGYSGEICVDNRAQTLTISVIPRDKRIENAVSTTRALSGGERSYSTIAFLISLWACVDHPFYFLDEYDVFTDEVNRDYMTKLLISEGKRRATRQYTFLTPLDMALDAAPFIQIHRLDAPNRRAQN